MTVHGCIYAYPTSTYFDFISEPSNHMQLRERQNNQLLQMEKHQEEASRLR